MITVDRRLEEVPRHRRPIGPPGIATLPDSTGVALPATASPPRMLAVSHTGLFSGAEAVLARVLEAAADDGWAIVCLTPAGQLAERLRTRGIATQPLPELKLPGGPRLWGLAVLGLRSAVGRPAPAPAGAPGRPRGRERDPGAARTATRAPPAAGAWLVHDVIHRRDWRRAARRLRRRGGRGDRRLGGRGRAGPRRWGSSPGRSARRPLAGRADVRAAHDPAIVGCIALLTSWKGHDVLLEAVARLPAVELELVGGTFPKDAAYAERLRARASEPDLAGRVRFLGHVDDVLARACARGASACRRASTRRRARSRSSST